MIDRAGLTNAYRKRSGYSLGISFAPDWGEWQVMSLYTGVERELEPGMVFHIPTALRDYGVSTVGVSATAVVTEGSAGPEPGAPDRSWRSGHDPVPVAESGAPPGLRHAGLALIAEALGARELRADGRARSDDDVHAVQHVTADGRLGPNGLLWIDRSGLDATDATDGPGAVLVPRAEPRAFSIAWSGPGRAVVRDARGGAFADIERDRFGRPFLRRAGSAPGEPAGGRASRDGPRVTVVGEAGRLRDVYPAVLASVGDAADRLGLVPAVRIVAPRSGMDWPDVLAGTDGLVLPAPPTWARSRPGRRGRRRPEAKPADPPACASACRA